MRKALYANGKEIMMFVDGDKVDSSCFRYAGVDYERDEESRRCYMLVMSTATSGKNAKESAMVKKRISAADYNLNFDLAKHDIEEENGVKLKRSISLRPTDWDAESKRVQEEVQKDLNKLAGSLAVPEAKKEEVEVMEDKAQQLQAELDNVAVVLRGYAADNFRIYKDAKEQLGEDSHLAIAKKAALDEITSIMEELGIEWELKNFYFTFGSAKQFPYGRGQYVVVKAQDIREAARKYKRKYPNPHDDEVLNCADYYSQQAWDERIKQYYGDTEPAEVIE